MSAPLKKVGKQTLKFSFSPYIAAAASVVGPKEGRGPLRATFDRIVPNSYYGEKTWERAERKMLKESIELAIAKAGLRNQDIDYLLSGDLLNQTISANFAAQSLSIPFLGLYGACSTMFEGLALGAMLIDGGFANNVVAATSSHYDTAERQYRFPTEQGVQRPLSAQWTVTGAGACMLGRQGMGPRITYATVGKVISLGQKDPNDMGGAMAPAAVDTLVTHFRDTGRRPNDYDLILTGDLGAVGKELTLRLAEVEGYDLASNYQDCGLLIFGPEEDVHAGGSGCACSAVVVAGWLVNKMRDGTYRRVLGIGTGALLSKTSTEQAETIPCIGHAVALEMV